MSFRPAGPMLPLISAARDTAISLTVELESDTIPIEGRLVAGGEEIPFTGWVGFAAAIESVIATSEPEE
jgi:hypothetical protein